MRETLVVSIVVVEACKLIVKRAQARGLPIDPATLAIANARGVPHDELPTRTSEGRTD